MEAKSIEQRMEQMVIAQVRTAEASERMAVALERMATAQEATAAYVIGTRGGQTDASKAATTASPVKEKAPKKDKPAPEAEPAPAIADLGGGAEPSAVEYSAEDVANGLRNVIAKENGKQTKAMELIVKYGGNKNKPLIKDIKAENYSAIMADIAAFIGV